MASIQSSPHPLVFRVADPGALGIGGLPPSTGVRVRTHARSLEGMQKEALVAYGPTGSVWRMVSDEGPYLNGTDLAPFPLAFFTVGMVCSFMSEIQALARTRGIRLDDFELTQDNFYTMEGSAARGTMIGGALPVELSATVDSGTDASAMTDLVSSAVAASPANGLLRAELASAFSLRHNGRTVAVDPAKAVRGEHLALRADAFDRAEPVSSDRFAPGIITKVESAKTVFGEGGAGSSLKAEQKRTLHVRGICRLGSDGMKEVAIQLFKPIGSMFRFLADDSARFSGGERAPSGLAYLSAGIAFCYMTQIGRYAHILKHDLRSYRIVQDTRFSLPGASGGTREAGSAQPVETHVDIDSGESDEAARKMVQMGEQTCFLHAACRTPLHVKVRVDRRSTRAA